MNIILYGKYSDEALIQQNGFKSGTDLILWTYHLHKHVCTFDDLHGFWNLVHVQFFYNETKVVIGI